MDFKELSKSYNKKDIQDALRGMFMQKNIYPNLLMNPNHFLNMDKDWVGTYSTLFLNKNIEFYFTNNNNNNSNELPATHPSLRIIKQ